MDEQRQDHQLEPTYNTSMAIQDVALKIYRKRWTIEKGGGRGPGRSALVADMMMMMIDVKEIVEIRKSISMLVKPLAFGLVCAAFKLGTVALFDVGKWHNRIFVKWKALPQYNPTRYQNKIITKTDVTTNRCHNSLWYKPFNIAVYFLSAHWDMSASINNSGKFYLHFN